MLPGWRCFPDATNELGGSGVESHPPAIPVNFYEISLGTSRKTDVLRLKSQYFGSTDTADRYTRWEAIEAQ